ncbi:MAG TPA: hypothetical protein VK859_02955 [bacterium]|jgi:hypothetical protein|nr:hypothetical protein [bacterium]
MLKNKKNASVVNKRKTERRKAGDRRFPGRLIDKRAGAPRKGDRRRSSGRRKK